MKREQKPLQVGIISLGCAKNLVDAELMLGNLLQSGHQITNQAEEADVLIVNTCSFIDSAQEESVDTILEAAEIRKTRRPEQGLIVSGCLPQRYRDELPKLFPEVDAFMGIDQVTQAGEIVQKAFAHRREKSRGTTAPAGRKKILTKFQQLEKTQGHEEHPPVAVDPVTRNTRTVLEPKNDAPFFDVATRPTYIPDYGTPRFRLTPKHFAYLKIAEGCNHPCSFCIIPRMRGSHRSRAQDDIVREAQRLVAEGVKEINLISQDTTYYGLDLRAQRNGSIAAPEKFAAATRQLPADAATLSSLLRDLNRIEGDFWIRLLYTHPAHWTDELIETIASCPKVARYVDMPLQHIHHNMLERMRRETSEEYIIKLIGKIRAGIPGIALRTTFIVGFPGETAACFQRLVEFIRETQFERAGVFTYSQEDGTRAAKMENQIAAGVKAERRELAMAAQHEVAVQVARRFVGRTLKVLVEGEASGKELQKAKVLSWEHGLLRSESKPEGQLRGKYLVARGEADAPDIDGRVYIRGKAPVGDFAPVKVIGHTDYDLIANLAP